MGCAYARHEISHTGACMVVMLCVGMMRLWMRHTRVHVYAMYVWCVCMLCIGGGDAAGASSCLVWACWCLSVLCGRGCWGLRLGGRAAYVACEWLCSAYTMHACLQQCSRAIARARREIANAAKEYCSPHPGRAGGHAGARAACARHPYSMTQPSSRMNLAVDAAVLFLQLGN